MRRAALLLLVLLALPARAEELLVSAAASLTSAFREVGAAFAEARPGTGVVFNFAASGPLLQQVQNGAPVDVFASADQETLDRGEAKGLFLSATRRDFASNRLVLIRPASAAGVQAVADLRQPAARRIAVGNPASVPAGRYTREALQAEHLWQALEPKLILADSVRQVLDYVARGEVDAGFVYATDAALARDKVRIAAELATVKPVRYPIAVVAASRHRGLAEDFAAFVAGPAGQAILARHGFGRP